MRKKLIAGNWKMNNDLQESKTLVDKIIIGIKSYNLEKTEILICLPFISLSEAGKQISSEPIELGAQNMYFENNGAFTGEISASMLKSVGCKYVILGHSERRKIFCESDELINNKVKKAVESDLISILCVGETLEEREAQKQNEIVRQQLESGLKGITKDKLNKIVIAYEPVWAIGTGKNATPDEANEMHKYIRKVISEMYDSKSADEMRVLYGGSLNEKNCNELLSQSDIDGGLIGGASLKPESFITIIQTSVNLK